MTDNDIYSITKEDSEKGFRLIMDKYGEPIYWHIRRMVVAHDDAQDAVQETFVKAFRSFSSLKEGGSLKAWLYKIATREALNSTRSNKIPQSALLQLNEQTGNIVADSYVDYGDVEAIKLQKAILQLPPKQQAIFNMRYYDDMDYRQIAEATETTVSTAKVNYHLAKEKIIRYMNSNE